MYICCISHGELRLILRESSESTAITRAARARGDSLREAMSPPTGGGGVSVVAHAMETWAENQGFKTGERTIQFLIALLREECFNLLPFFFFLLNCIDFFFQ